MIMQAPGQIAPLAIVVDDEPSIRQFVNSVAEQAGFAVQMAADGGELLSMLSERSPTVIVLDLNMSNTDGVQVMRELAARHLKSKIVILSGSDLRVLETSSEIARQRGLTISAVLQKPIRKAELLAILRQLNLETEPFSSATLRSCLNEHLLTLHYQPKISLPSLEAVSCEALLRCQDPAGRLVAPESVVAVAEKAGMIDEVTGWVFRQAMEQRRRWSEQGLDLGMAVNLSARSSFNQDLPELFAACCSENNVPMEAVTIELTETAVMNDQLLAMETMVRLRLKGFDLSIDDFGTGYSSLLRLKQMPFTEMKVDKSFVIALHESRDNAVIVKAIIQLAQSLEMRCVVEGVEDQAALDFASGLGCNAAQGYFIGRPMPGSEIGGFVKSWQWRKNAARAKSDVRDHTNEKSVRDRNL